MVEKEVIDAGTPKVGPYSHAIKVGNLIFVSGQGAAPGTTNITEQTTTGFEKIKTILVLLFCLVITLSYAASLTL